MRGIRPQGNGDNEGRVNKESQHVMSHETHHRYEWNAIPWRKLEVKVFKLQRRIYQATTRGETKKAHRLEWH